MVAVLAGVDIESIGGAVTVLSLSPASLGTQLEAIHQRLQADLPGIDRVAAALYDPKTDVLKTFVNSTEGGSPLAHYDIRLGEVPSLVELVRERHTRVVTDLSVFQGSTREHTRRLLEKGYRSSYTVPFFDGGSLAGFLFFKRDIEFLEFIEQRVAGLVVMIVMGTGG